MGIARPAEKVKLIAGLISNNPELFGSAERMLESRLSNKIDFESEILDFAYTGYYKKEMGENLKRKFISFRKPVALKHIEKAKIISNNIERLLSRQGRRRINIDPGYLDLAKLVLFSTKDYAHRVHVGRSIFAEVTLYFKDETFNAWPWTYPDYRTNSYISIFNGMRERFKKDIKGK